MVDMSQGYFLVIYFLVMKFKLNSANMTQPTELNQICNLYHDIDNLDQNSTYICRKINYTADILNHLPIEATALIIEDSFIVGSALSNVSSQFKKYDLLHTVIIKRSFIGLAVKWIYTLTKLKNYELINSSTTFLIGNIAMYTSGNISAIDLNLKYFPDLQRLKISGCNISNIDISQGSSVPELILSDNSFECGNNFIWLYDLYQNKTGRVELDNTKCFMKKVNEHVQYPMIYSVGGKDLLKVLHYKREVAYNCPSKCVCELQGMLTLNRIQLFVDCIGLNMTELPAVIPHGTSRCNFSHNLIKDLTPLYTNVLYSNVSLIGLSHNQISYLDPVKFTDLLRQRHDFGIWLNHNQLEKFPAEQINKVYAAAANKLIRYMPQFLLGHNPYLCSCDYIRHFQDFIYQQMQLIHDTRYIQCSPYDPVYPDEKVLTLDVGTLCSTDPLFETLDLLNLVLSVILLILIVDFAHNYYHYKKNRKLPWIVTRIKF